MNSLWQRKLKKAPTVVIGVFFASAGIISGMLTAPLLPTAAAGATPSAVESTSIPVPAVSDQTVSNLPPVVYNAVIPALSAVTSKQTTGEFKTAKVKGGWAIAFDKAGGKPIGLFLKKDFTNADTIISIVEVRQGWARVLTPARKLLPSQAGGDAPAQTAAWIPLTQLTQPKAADTRIVIDVENATLTVNQEGEKKQEFSVGVGADATGTPAGITGYLQARYKAPETATGDTLVQLTSMHSAVEDDPAGGTDGGLIALHYWPEATGAISHGCVRLTTAALAAVDEVPLGTPIEIR